MFSGCATEVRVLKNIKKKQRLVPYMLNPSQVESGKNGESVTQGGTVVFRVLKNGLGPTWKGLVESGPVQSFFLFSFLF